MSRARQFLAVLTAAAGLAAFAAPAQAGVLVSSASDCADQSAAKVFLPWADVADYVPAPGHDAESATGWTLTGGASIASGNEPWTVSSPEDSHSLSLPAGASATTAAMCVGITHPTLRFFAKQTSGSSVFDEVDVEVLYEDAAGNVRSTYIGSDNGYGWNPTVPMVVTPALLALLPGEHTAVAFRFTADGGSFRIDDVYVDPWGRG